jgi:opacity protein-like surface antigen
MTLATRAAFILAAFTTITTATAAPARADWLFTPYLGVSFGGDTEGQNITYGGSFGYMGAGIIGFEFDASFAPDLLDIDDGIDLDIAESNVTTLMGNLIIGAPIGGQDGVRPYVSGGAGLLRTSVTTANEFFDIDENSFGINVGAGVMGFVRENFGLRGDVRYFRSVQDSDVGDDIDFDFGSFDFWRTTVGATFRF